MLPSFGSFVFGFKVCRAVASMRQDEANCLVLILAFFFVFLKKLQLTEKA